MKPFIYALALDQGLIHPLTVLKDAPTAFGPFSPENFDGRFVGPITATEALGRSRNVPAVALSARLAQPGFYQLLQSAGLAHGGERHYGLALALGGGEMTMEEPGVRDARQPRHARPSPSTKDPLTDGLRLLSEEASFLTLEMLRSPRPGELST